MENLAGSIPTMYKIYIKSVVSKWKHLYVE